MKKILPTQFNKTEQISTINTLTKITRSKIFNHKEFIKVLDTKQILDNMINLPCNCTIPPFTDPNHGHIVNGDIRIVQNIVSINLSNSKTEIKHSLTKFFSHWWKKNGVPFKCFTHSISIVMGKVNNKIKRLKSTFKFSKVKQVPRNPKVISYLNVLQEHYVMCPNDKAANNIAFICKKYVQIMSKCS